MTTIVPASARPIISADAVAAVRRGFAASVLAGEHPDGAVAAPEGRSGHREQRTAIIGLADATPSRTASTPAPMNASGFGTSSTSPKTSETRPAGRRAAPLLRSRRRIEVSGSAMSSLSAWTGAIRAVRRAGT